MPVMTAEELTTFLHHAFPDAPPPFVVTAVSEGAVEVTLPDEAVVLRPGGTVSGPTLMTLADTAGYVAVLAEIGPVALAVTSSLTIHFLRKPLATGLVATTDLMRLGRRQAVIDVRIRSSHAPEPVAHTTVTYAIPVSGPDAAATPIPDVTPRRPST